jgi:hypothetical protein
MNRAAGAAGRLAGRKPEPVPVPGVEPGDRVFFTHGDEPHSGKVICHGKHGCTVDHDGVQRKVRWESVLGHHTRAERNYEVIDRGETGAIVHDGRRRRFIEGEVPEQKPDEPAQDDVARVKRMVSEAVEPMKKALPSVSGSLLFWRVGADLLKTHVSAYTDKNGRFVAAHEDNRVLSRSHPAFNLKNGTWHGAQLISSQDYLNDEVVQEKREKKDYRVQVSPEFEVDGEKFRVILDGHHSLAAALEDDASPTFEEQDSRDSDHIGLLESSVDDFLEAVHMGDDWRNRVTGKSAF